MTATAQTTATVELSAGPIEYRDEGAGPALVLLHGLAMDGAVWQEVVEDLRRDHRLIRPTLPLGAHRLPMRPDADLSLRGLGRVVADFLEALELDRVTLCFNDWNAAPVMAADGLLDRVGRLVITDCEAFENYPPGLPGRMAALSVRMPGGLQLMRRTLTVRWLRQSPLVFGHVETVNSRPAVPDLGRTAGPGRDPAGSAQVRRRRPTRPPGHAGRYRGAALVHPSRPGGLEPGRQADADRARPSVRRASARLPPGRDTRRLRAASVRPTRGVGL
jgi:pimeloyl-ACP methyl ester carboxylesterase